MTEKEVWLILFQAILSDEANWTLAADAGIYADKALLEYKARWGDEAQDES